MIEVTPAAMEKIKDFLQKNRISSGIRVTLMEGGCSGAALGIVLDEAGDDDLVATSDGIEFMIHRDLFQECGDVVIDFAESDGSCACNSGGFRVNSEKPVNPAGGCSCG